MTTEFNDETTNARLNTDCTTVRRVIDETTAYSAPGNEPFADVASVAMHRRSDLYDGGARLAFVNVPPEDMGTPREFEIRYIEAFDQILPELGAGEWAAIRRAWEDMEWSEQTGDLADHIHQAMEQGVDGHLTTYLKELAPLFVALTQDDPAPATEDARDELAQWLGDTLNEPPENFTKRSPMLAGLIRAGLYAADADGVEALQAAREAQMRQQADGL